MRFLILFIVALAPNNSALVLADKLGEAQAMVLGQMPTERRLQRGGRSELRWLPTYASPPGSASNGD